MSSALTANQRKNTILDILNQEAEVRVADLAGQLSVTPATVRSDLAEMEEEGLLRRTHGGAVSTKKPYFNMSANDRMNINREEKILIAKACANLINDGDTLMIDSGSSTRYLARELALRNNLTIVTNALQIAEELYYNNSINVILIGGNLDLQYQFTYGPDAIAQLGRYRADKMILAVDGISAERGLSTYHSLEADVSRQMIERSNTVITIADHSKIGREGFFFIVPLDNIHTLITDENNEKRDELNNIKSAGIDVTEV